MAAVPSERTLFFTQLSSFPVSWDMQYGLANDHYTEYVLSAFLYVVRVAKH